MTAEVKVFSVFVESLSDVMSSGRQNGFSNGLPHWSYLFDRLSETKLCWNWHLTRAT